MALTLLLMLNLPISEVPPSSRFRLLPRLSLWGHNTTARLYCVGHWLSSQFSELPLPAPDRFLERMDWSLTTRRAPSPPCSELSWLGSPQPARGSPQPLERAQDKTLNCG